MSMRKTLPFLNKKNRKNTLTEEPQAKINENNVSTKAASTRREDLYEKIPPTEHLHKILSSTESSYYFKKFVTRKFCSETLSFWVAVEHYRHSKELNISLFSYAKEIYSSYLMHGGDKEVNLENQQRDLDISVPIESTFDHLQNIAWQLLVTSDYPKYVNSTEYKEYLDNQSLKPLRRTVTLERLDDIIKFGFKLQDIKSALSDSDSSVQLTADHNSLQKKEVKSRNNSDDLSEEFIISSDEEFDSNSNRKTPQEEALEEEDIPKETPKEQLVELPEDLPPLESPWDPEPETVEEIQVEPSTPEELSEDEKEEIVSPPAEVDNVASEIEDELEEIQATKEEVSPVVEEPPSEEEHVLEPEITKPPVEIEVVSIPVPENVKVLDKQWDEIHKRIQSIIEKREHFLEIHKQQSQQYQSMVSNSSVAID